MEFKGLINLKPILKDIYLLFSSYLSNDVNQGNYMNTGAETALKLYLKDTTAISTILLNELHKKLSLISHEVSLCQDVHSVLLEDNIRDSREEILLLLRCSCLMVRLHPHDQTVGHNFQAAVTLLHRLSIQLTNTPHDKPIDSSVRLVKQMLEVYLDEVIVERPFKDCLAFSESILSNRQNHSMCSSMKIKSMLEVVAIHFLLSAPRGHALQTFLESLILTEKRVPSSPELCLTVGLSLIKHPAVMSAPVIVHSHLISLVSEVIGTCFIPLMAELNVRKSKVYLSAFYDAAIMYSKHFSKLVTSSFSQLESLGKSSHRVFDSLFQFEIFYKVCSVLVDMDRAWRSQIGETTSTNAISYVQTNIHIIGEIHRDYVFTFMSSVISQVVSAEIDELLLERTREMALQDVCLLASLLKLMSCSLLQATSYSKSGFSCLELLLESKHKLSSSLSGTMSCFSQQNVLPMKVQQVIVEGLRLGSSFYDDYKLLFVHFAGLLALCMNSGFDILVKNCLTFMLVLLNIVTQEEGTSDFVRQSGLVSSAHAVSEANPSETAMESTPKINAKSKTKISSMRTASKFQQAKHLFLRSRTSRGCSDISDEETCNGEAYLRCFTNNSKDITELADFIECQQDKDYSSWLVNRGKFRYKILEKRAKQRKTRMKKVTRAVVKCSRVYKL
ncbi:hypothetical protein vseg_020866 [Gypsophila vaccaria]